MRNTADTPSKRNIVLFGFMGTGKSAVAEALGRKLGMPVAEMDAIIEEREGNSISRIFADKGEDYFRRRERELVRELGRRRGMIIATGGGVVLDPDNIRDLGGSGILVCLRARPRVILERVEEETHRPLLEVSNRLEIIETKLESRRPFYDRIDHQIETSGLTVEEVADRIADIYCRGG